MAKAPVPTLPQAPPGIDPAGPSEFRAIVKSTVMPSTFQLEDGTTISLTPVLANVRRLLGQFTLEGDPVYLFGAGLLPGTNAPQELRRPQKKKAKSNKRKTAKKAGRK